LSHDEKDQKDWRLVGECVERERREKERGEKERERERRKRREKKEREREGTIGDWLGNA